MNSAFLLFERKNGSLKNRGLSENFPKGGDASVPTPLHTTPAPTRSSMLAPDFVGTRRNKKADRTFVDRDEVVSMLRGTTHFELALRFVAHDEVRNIRLCLSSTWFVR